MALPNPTGTILIMIQINASCYLLVVVLPSIMLCCVCVHVYKDGAAVLGVELEGVDSAYAYIPSVWLKGVSSVSEYFKQPTCTVSCDK